MPSLAEGVPPNQAELKTQATRKPISKLMPQLWFGRTPYLISGFHTNGTFQDISATKAKDKFEEWETRETNQTDLRKLVSLLSRLRMASESVGGKACIAICERGVKPVNLRVFLSKDRAKPLPDGVIRNFWVGKTNEVPSS